MLRRLLILIGLALALPAPALAQEATIVSRDVPLAGERTLASAGAPARFDLVGLHWRGTGTVQFRTRSTSGSWSAWENAAPEAEDRPDAGTAERARSDTLAARQPVVGRAVRPDRVPAARERHPPAGLVRLEPRRRRPGADAAEGGCAGDRAARRLEGRREDPARGTLVRRQPADRDRPPHGGCERLHRGPGTGDRPSDRALPREGERLERHRLQLPRRPLRHRLRGPLRRDRAQRRRSACGGVQHRLLRRGGARRVQLARGRREGAQRAGRAPRLAARHRARRPGHDAVVHLRRQRPLRAGLPVFLRTVSGHRDTGFTDCPGTALYNLLNSIAGEVSRIGLPKLYAPTVTRHRPRHGAIPGEAVVTAALDGRCLRRVGQRRRVLARHRRQRRLDVGREGGGAGQLLVRDPLGRTASRLRRA